MVCRWRTHNAEHSSDLGVATKEPREGRPASGGHRPRTDAPG